MSETKNQPSTSCETDDPTPDAFETHTSAGPHPVNEPENVGAPEVLRDDARSDTPAVLVAAHVERVAELEKECNRLAVEVLRHQVATAKGVPLDLLTGTTRDELETFANALLEFTSTPRGPLVPSDGTAPTKAALRSDWLRNELSKR